MPVSVFPTNRIVLVDEGISASDAIPATAKPEATSIELKTVVAAELEIVAAEV